MTNDEKLSYNKGKPIKCDCGKVLAFKKDGYIYIKCKGCNRIVAIVKS